MSDRHTIQPNRLRGWAAAALVTAGLALLPGGRGRAAEPAWYGMGHRFRPETRNAINAYILAWHAQLAQRDARLDGRSEANHRRRVRKLLTEAGFDRVTFPGVKRRWFPDTDVQAFVASNDEHVLVSFRGTEVKLADILQDAEFALTPFGYGKPGSVHTGFKRGHDSVWGSLVQELEAVRTRRDGGQKSIWLTGHSLGGALAELTAYRLALTAETRREPAPECHLVTFGSPRVGNPTYRDQFNRRISAYRRMVYNQDVVPRLPPRLPEIRGLRFLPVYVHSGEQWHFNSAYRESGLSREPQLLDYGGLTTAFVSGLLPRQPITWLKRPQVPRVGPQLTALVNGMGRPKADHGMEHYLRSAYSAIPVDERDEWPAPRDILGER